MECGLCGLDYSDPTNGPLIATRCGHTYHMECALTILKKKECPECTLPLLYPFRKHIVLNEVLQPDAVYDCKQCVWCGAATRMYLCAVCYHFHEKGISVRTPDDIPAKLLQYFKDTYELKLINEGEKTYEQYGELVIVSNISSDVAEAYSMINELV